jgi:putative sigma-54 modulation protein
MDISFKSKSGHVPNDLQAYTSQKLVKLGKFSERIISVLVTFDEENSRKKEAQCKAEFQLNIPGQALHVEQAGANCRSAVDLGVEALKKQLVRETDKRSTRLREAADVAKAVAHTAAPARRTSKATAIVGVGPRLLSERYSVKPQNVDEAIAELELNKKRGFLVFVNPGGAVNVVYRKGTSQYVIMEPEKSA